MAHEPAATLLARVGNDAMAELCAKHPDRFPGFAAALSLHDVDGAVAEARRAVRGLGARGVQIYTNVAGIPLDDPRFGPVFAVAAEHDLPIWLHPARTSAMADYAGESRSRYEMWWCFGWPYETSVAMTRLVFCGLFDRHPGLKIITHHCGGMIPYYDGRIGAGMAFLGSRDKDEDYSKVLPSLKRPHLDYFRDFYGDTAMFGGRAGLKAGLDFFGVDHVIFATDAPLAPIVESIAAVRELGLPPAAAEQVFSGNAKRLLKL
jgi:aminocarboxymuconate-semialdehyde decarboxylase